MNFLNEAATRYPAAISLAAGRPPGCLPSAERLSAWVTRFVDERARTSGAAVETVWRSLGQYGPASGIIRDLVARWLARDEALHVDPADLMITNGMQEGALLALLCLCDGPGDVVLAEDPTYVGLTGAALLARVPLVPVHRRGPLSVRTLQALERVSAEGRRARAFYVIPDFSNPSGQTLTLDERRRLIEIAREHQLVLIEDTAYRAFRYEGEPLPTLKALDGDGCVIQIGSFSKIFMPSPRIAYVYADQAARSKSGAGSRLIDELAKAKGFVSVLTSPLAQATLGGFLLEHDFTLATWNAPRIRQCKANRDALLDACARHLRGELNGLEWSRPEGGFFLTLTLPIAFEHDEMLACARDYGVIVCPLSYFTTAREHSNTIRLSFSHSTPDEAEEGIVRLGKFLRDRLAHPKGSTNA